MLYNDYPLIINNEEIKPTRQSWALRYSNIHNENMTEDGHSDIEVIRKGKVEISASFNCTDRWASILTQLNSQTMLSVKYYDIAAKDYVTRPMYMDGLNVQQVYGSEKVQESNGLYIVSFSLLEF